MPMTLSMTRNAPDRFRGFLASCMLEVAPGVYVAPRMGKAVRERVWEVIQDWAELLPEDGGLVLLWSDPQVPSGIGIRMIGWPKTELLDHEGVWLALGQLTQQHDMRELETLAGTDRDT